MSGPGPSSRRFYGLLACAVVFVYSTSGLLPEVVGSHFNAGGRASGFLPRAFYRFAVLAIVLLPPLLLAVIPRLSLSSTRARINIPNSDYWLAPERRAETVALITQQCMRFGEVLLVFLCYVHWLVVRANLVRPPQLSSGWFLAGLVAFLGFTVRWALHFTAHFRRDANAQ